MTLWQSGSESRKHTSYGKPTVGLKSHILSSLVDEENVETIVEKVLEAREKGAL